MPVYRNDGTTSFIARNTSGKTITVNPGDIIITYEIVTATGATRISEAPYWNPANEVTEVTSTGSGYRQDITLNVLTDSVEIFNGSAQEITVYLNDVANMPGLIVPCHTSLAIRGMLNKVSTLCLFVDGATEAGQIIVTEIREGVVMSLVVGDTMFDFDADGNIQPVS